MKFVSRPIGIVFSWRPDQLLSSMKLALSEIKCVGVFQHHCPVAGERENGILPVPVRVKPFVVNKIEVDAFARIVTKPDIGNYRVDSTVILDKSGG